MQAASHRPSPPGLRAPTAATAFGVLATTGMRISALVALENDDLELIDGLLTMRPTTFGTSRGLPLQPTRQQARWRYGTRRDRV